MRALLLAIVCLFAFSAYVSAQTASDSCTVVSSGCLNGMNVTSKYWRSYQGCYDRIQYVFTKSKCDISNFVTNGARPLDWTPGQPKCTSDTGSNGYNAIFCPTFGELFDSPYKIDLGGGCSGTVTVDMIVPSGNFVEGVIGLKGGRDCATCDLMTYRPWAPNTISFGACTADADCDDNNPCTIDTCTNSTSCSVCSNTQTTKLCYPCVNDTQCESAPLTSPCDKWVCDTTAGTCSKTTEPGCFACTSDDNCPTIGEAESTCISNKCNISSGLCYSSQIPDCCEGTTVTTTKDTCFTCTKKTGCTFSTSLQCVPNFNETSGVFNASVANCTTFKDGDGGSSGDLSGGEVAAIVVPIVVVTGLAGLALLTFGIAVAFLVAKYWQKSAIAAQLQAVGFSEEESNLILNSALYKTEGGENPFFITTDDSGTRVLHVPGH